MKEKNKKIRCCDCIHSWNANNWLEDKDKTNCDKYCCDLDIMRNKIDGIMLNELFDSRYCKYYDNEDKNNDYTFQKFLQDLSLNGIEYVEDVIKWIKNLKLAYKYSIAHKKKYFIKLTPILLADMEKDETLLKQIKLKDVSIVKEFNGIFLLQYSIIKISLN